MKSENLTKTITVFHISHITYITHMSHISHTHHTYITIWRHGRMNFISRASSSACSRFIIFSNTETQSSHARA